MRKKRFLWSFLPGLCLLVGVAAGYGSAGCNDTTIGGDDPNADGSDTTDMLDPNSPAVRCAEVNANCGLISDGQAISA